MNIEIYFDSCDSRSHSAAGSAFDRMVVAAKEFFGESGCTVEIDNGQYAGYRIIVSRPNGRGLVQKAKAFCNKNCYWVLSR